MSDSPLSRWLFLRSLPPAFLISSLVALAGCSVGEFLGAYFNTYYNASRAFSEAETELLTAQALDPKQAEKGYLAPYVVPAGAKTKFTAVIEKCSKLLQYHPESGFVDDALMMIGRSYYYQNENQSAERKFRELIDGQPESELVPEAKMLLANTLYRAGDRDGAGAAAREILEDTEERYPPGVRARAALLLATLEVDTKNYEAAREHYASVAGDAETQEERVAARMRVADMEVLLNNPARAGEAYARAEEEAPDYLSEYRASIGRARMLSAVGQHDDALALLQDLLANSNNKEFFAEIDFEIGNAYRSMGDAEAAVDHYRYVDTAYARTEFSGKASYELGLLYEKQLQLYDSARVAYTRGRATAGQTPVAALLATRADAMTRYATLRADLAKNDSLRQAILFPPDSLTADTSFGENRSAGGDTLAAGGLAETEDSLPDSAGESGTAPEAVRPDDAQEPPVAPAGSAADTVVEVLGDKALPDQVSDSEPLTEQGDSVAAGLMRDSVGLAGGKVDSAAQRPRWVPVTIPIDTVEARLALGKSELGALFFNAIERNDSASYWFSRLLTEHPTSVHVPRALYTLAQIARQDSAPAVADSLYQVLAGSYPLSEFGATARKFLGIPDPVDSVAVTAVRYETAERLLEEGKPKQALEAFSALVREHPSSPVAARAEYAVGWIYEQVIDEPESALVHYRALAERYPSSTYAVTVKPRLEAVDQELRAQEAAETARRDSITRAQTPVPPAAQPDSSAKEGTGAPVIQAAEPDSVNELPQSVEPDSAAQPAIEVPPGGETPEAPSEPPPEPPGEPPPEPPGEPPPEPPGEPPPEERQAGPLSMGICLLAEYGPQ